MSARDPDPETTELTELLLDSITPVPPPPRVREALMRRVESQGKVNPLWQEWADDAGTPGLFTLRGDQGEWEETGIEGIQVRRLFVDRAANRMTALFKMAPGTAYVPHVHAGPEECYVLEGDLHVGEEIVMHAGDYQRAAAGSLHGVQRTEGGCLLLVSSALDDEQL